MKKSLVALAALAATSSFAQVTLSGNIDFASASVGGTQAWAKGSTISQTVGVASTSVINIRAVENLGGGLKVTGHYGLDPRTLANDAYAVTSNTGAVTNSLSQACTTTLALAAATSSASCTIGSVGGQANTATGLSRDEVFVGIEGGFGNVRLGAPNSIGLNSFQVSSPLGTGIGSAYTAGGTAGTMTNSFVATRYNRSIRWDSPVMSGLTASVLYAPGNDIAKTSTPAITSPTTGGITPAVPAANLIPNARKATEFGLRYANGPLTVSYANITQAAQTNATGWYAGGSNTAGKKTSASVVDASYNLGTTTLYAGWNTGDRLAPLGAATLTAADTTKTVESKGSRFAIKQNFGTVDVMAQYTRQEALGVTGVSTSGGTTTVDTALLKATVLGLRADYNLSKTAAIYAGYEKFDSGAAYAASAFGSTGTRTITSVGLKKSF